jgi:hypothetical protein
MTSRQQEKGNGLSTCQVKTKKLGPLIPLTWKSTTVPLQPVSLPIGVILSVTERAIPIHIERKDSGLFPIEKIDFQFSKDEILGVDIILPETTRSYIVTVRHRDPFDVVPSFQSTFTFDKAYWLKALMKVLKEILGIKANVKVEPF